MNRCQRTFVAALLALSLAAAAGAQTLAEVTLTTAIASQLYPGLSLPSGSLRAMGVGTEAVIARVPDAAAWTGWEVYTAAGLAASLEGALVYGVERDLFLEGYGRVETTPTQEGATTITRVVFENETGARALLVTFRESRELVWLVARSR